MIVVHKDAPKLKMTKPIKCPLCGYKRAFNVPKNACVRTSERGIPPPDSDEDIAFLKCKNCGNQIGITMEK